MIDPPLESLLERVDNRFSLVVVTAKRARLLLEGAHKLTNSTSTKPVTVAISEVNEGMITYVRTKSGIK